MNEPAESRTVSVSIRLPADDVYNYLSEVENFPLWSAFAKSVRKEGSDWMFETPGGVVRVRFASRNKLRVLDHYVTLESRLTVYVPVRVVANGPDGSEVIFTVFRSPDTSDEKFAEDVDFVVADLKSLKRVLETTDPAAEEAE